MISQRKFKKNLNSYFLIFLMALFFLTINQKVEAQLLSQLLYYPADAISLYGTPSIFVPPPLPTALGIPPFNLYYPAIGSVPATLVPPPTALSRVALTAINPVAASSIFPFLPPLASVIPAASSSIYNLYYPAVGSLPGTFILPPTATGVGTLPYNLYYPPSTTTPGLFILPPV